MFIKLLYNIEKYSIVQDDMPLTKISISFPHFRFNSSSFSCTLCKFNSSPTATSPSPLPLCWHSMLDSSPTCSARSTFRTTRRKPEQLQPLSNKTKKREAQFFATNKPTPATPKKKQRSNCFEKNFMLSEPKGREATMPSFKKCSTRN